MKPYKVSFYIYSDNEEDVMSLQKTMNDFVREKYNIGILVTAKKLSDAMKNFAGNFLVTNFLKK